MWFVQVFSFFDDLVKEFKENPLYFWIIVGALALIVVLIILAIVIKAKNKGNNKESNESKLIKSTLKEEENTVEVKEEPKKVEEDDDLVEEEKSDAVVEEKEEKAVVLDEKETPEDIKEDIPATETVKEETKEEPVVISEPKTEEPVKPTPKKRVTKKKTKEPTENAVKEPAVVTENDKPKRKQAPKKANETLVEEAESSTATVQTGKEEKPKEVSTEEDAVKNETNDTPKNGRVINGKYEIYSDGTDYYYILKASNGEALITSEIYSSEKSVRAAIETIKNNLEVGTIKVREDKRGLYQFVLIARNNRTLVMSANYPTEKRAISASESFKRFAATSPIIDSIISVDTVKEEITIDRSSDKPNGKIGIIKVNEGYRYVLKASNGEILVHSAAYKTIKSAEDALARFKDSVETGKFYLVKDKRGYYQFKLFSSAGRIVGVGETYANKAQAISSANSAYSFIKLAQPFTTEE